MIEIQEALTERAIELLALPPAEEGLSIFFFPGVFFLFSHLPNQSNEQNKTKKKRRSETCFGHWMRFWFEW
jgi:hypothetical protein